MSDKKIPNPKRSFVDVYMQKCDMGMGKQDTLRRIMSVSGIRYFEGKVDKNITKV